MSCSTDIVAKLQEKVMGGNIPWVKPWFAHGMRCISHYDGHNYSPRNCLILDEPSEYFTFPQIKNEGGHLKAVGTTPDGKPIYPKSITIYLSKTAKHKAKSEDEDDEVYHLLKAHHVWPISMVEGIEPKYRDLWNPEGGEPKSNAEALAVVKEYCERVGVVINYGGNTACYKPSRDSITVPGEDAFKSADFCWHTIFHEVAHSTGKADRLNRVMDGTFGDSKYAFEELVADMCAAFCVARLGMDTEAVVNQCAGYIQHWKDRIQNYTASDFTKAADLAKVACDFIFNTQTEKE